VPVDPVFLSLPPNGTVSEAERGFELGRPGEILPHERVLDQVAPPVKRLASLKRRLPLGDGSRRGPGPKCAQLTVPTQPRTVRGP
jgi:hypothetical protein